MYRDDLASEAQRAEQLRRDVAALEHKVATLESARTGIEREGKLGRFGVLTRWWAIALVVVTLGGGLVLGNQLGMRERTVAKDCP